MFNDPIDAINFEGGRRVLRQNRPEDLILDHKVEWLGDLAWTLCAMANLQGGLVLVGVATEPGTRQPAWPPPGAEGTQDGLHQHAVQIALGHLPPVIPEVAVCPLPDRPDRAMVVMAASVGVVLLNSSAGRLISGGARKANLLLV